LYEFYHQVSPSILVNAKHIWHSSPLRQITPSSLFLPFFADLENWLQKPAVWLQPWTSHVLNQCNPWNPHLFSMRFNKWRRSRVWVQICCPSWRRAGESGWVKCFSNSLVIFRGFCGFSGFLLGFRWILWDVFRDSDCGIEWFSGIHFEFRVGFHGVSGTDLSNTQTHMGIDIGFIW
jgi:hypothetical protein